MPVKLTLVANYCDLILIFKHPWLFLDFFLVSHTYLACKCAIGGTWSYLGIGPLLVL